MRLTANRIASILRRKGYRLTPQRYAILKAIAASEEHLTPDDLLEKARVATPQIGRITIYRTLDILGQLGLVCRVHAPDGCRGYMMTRPTGHHHHLVCTGCGRTLDFSDCPLEELEKRLEQDTGFITTGHLLEVYGTCADCRAAAGS